ncbi:MAG: type I DNA topoisomerase [Patescibacteria group bacterium]|nr:type I DNA topoisomerase [Patescibacteria group bacterium]
MKNLVIVESPTKAKTISRFLGDGYNIKASMGHVMDLPKSKLGVDVDHNFEPLLELIPDKEKVISELKSLAKGAKSIILATDPDREGEAIASDIKDVLGSNSKFKIQNSKFRRIVFHEITREAIEEALKHPGDINNNLVDAQTARRILDRLVGYKLSPLLWRKVRRGLSAGRVQSIALRLIVEREREIEKFGKEEYWTITVLLSKKGTETEFELIEINGEKIESQKTFNLYDGEYKVSLTSIKNNEQAESIVEELKKKQFIVSDVSQKETRRSPQPPYTTSTLQQDGARRFGFSGKRTMRVAQKLYEEGFITYHRTDSVILSQSAVSSMRSFIKKEYGEKYLPESPRFYKTRQKLAQEAHEAIRPTKIGELKSQIPGVKSEVGGDGIKLYELIWKRAIASQMSDAIIESTTVQVDSKDNKYKLKTNGSVLVFEGFLKANPQALQDRRLPDFVAQEELSLKEATPIQHETTPPARYNDASLIATLEEKGIGRPSTYASIISVIEERRYVERTDARFVPTNVGIAVNDFLVKNFSDIDDIDFTALMEDELDEIAHGQRAWRPMIKEFYGPFSKKLEKTEDAKRVKIEVEKTDIPCEKCGKGVLVVRIGRFGKFLSCSRFPDCDFTKPFVEETNLTCPKCGGKVIIKRTRKGRRFYGCSNYPNCDFAAWKLEDIKNPKAQEDKKPAKSKTSEAK